MQYLTLVLLRIALPVKEISTGGGFLCTAGKEQKMAEKLSRAEKARIAHNEYNKAWRKKNKDKMRKYEQMHGESEEGEHGDR